MVLRDEVPPLEELAIHLAFAAPLRAYAEDTRQLIRRRCGHSAFRRSRSFGVWPEQVHLQRRGAAAGGCSRRDISADERVARSWGMTVSEQDFDARLECEQQVVRRGEQLRVSVRAGAVALLVGAEYGLERWDGATWVHVDPFDGEHGGWTAAAHPIPKLAERPRRLRVPEHTEPGRHRVTIVVSSLRRPTESTRLLAAFMVRDAPAVDYEQLLITGAWMGARPGTERAAVRLALGEPDERRDEGCVWRYGDLYLHFDAGRVRRFSGTVLPHELLRNYLADGRTGVWSHRLPSGARLEFERPEGFPFARLRGFSVTSPGSGK
jgi:hypothetical protein